MDEKKVAMITENPSAAVLHGEQPSTSHHGKSCKWTDLKKVIQETNPPCSRIAFPKQIPGSQPTALFIARDFSMVAAANSFDEVYPRVLLGDYHIAKNKDRLKRIGVTHVVNCAQGSKFCQIDSSTEYFADEGIKFFGIQAMDMANFKLINHFRPVADFMEESLSNNGILYVHCHQGLSRSAAIVVAFLMLKRGMTAVEALATIRQTRAVMPNDGFLKQLCTLNEELFPTTSQS